MSNNQISFNNQLTGIPNLEAILQQSREVLQEFATRPDFTDQMQLTFGEEVDVASLQETWVSGNLGTLPEIEVLPASEINGANGAFAKETNTLYLSQELLNQGNTDTITNVFLEEYGHYLDSSFTNTEVPGDEGALFSEFALDHKLSAQTISKFQNTNDLATVNFDGQKIIIETLFGGIGDTIGDGIDDITDPISDIVNEAKNTFTDQFQDLVNTGTFPESVSDLQDDATTIVENAVENASGSAEQVAENVTEDILKTIDFYVEGGEEIINVTGDLLKQTKDTLGDLSEATINQLSSAISGVQSTISDLSLPNLPNAHLGIVPTSEASVGTNLGFLGGTGSASLSLPIVLDTDFGNLSEPSSAIFPDILLGGTISAGFEGGPGFDAGFDTAPLSFPIKAGKGLTKDLTGGLGGLFGPPISGSGGPEIAGSVFAEGSIKAGGGIGGSVELGFTDVPPSFSPAVKPEVGAGAGAELVAGVSLDLISTTIDTQFDVIPGLGPVPEVVIDNILDFLNPTTEADAEKALKDIVDIGASALNGLNDSIDTIGTSLTNITENISLDSLGSTDSSPIEGIKDTGAIDFLTDLADPESILPDLSDIKGSIPEISDVPSLEEIDTSGIKDAFNSGLIGQATNEAISFAESIKSGDQSVQFDPPVSLPSELDFGIDTEEFTSLLPEEITGFLDNVENQLPESIKTLLPDNFGGVSIGGEGKATGKASNLLETLFPDNLTQAFSDNNSDSGDDNGDDGNDQPPEQVNTISLSNNQDDEVAGTNGEKDIFQLDLTGFANTGNFNFGEDQIANYNPDDGDVIQFINAPEDLNEIDELTNSFTGSFTNVTAVNSASPTGTALTFEPSGFDNSAEVVLAGEQFEFDTQPSVDQLRNEVGVQFEFQANQENSGDDNSDNDSPTGGDDDKGQPQTFEVVNTQDSGSGSLRNAIKQANANEGTDTITFDESILEAPFPGFTPTASIDLTSGQLEITDDLTIEGLGADVLTIDAGGDSRVFLVNNGSENLIDVNLSGLTIANGKTNKNGAGILNAENLTLTKSSVEFNSATGSQSPGGGIANINGSLDLVNSTVLGNNSDNSGGGIFSSSERDNALTILNSTISNNDAAVGGAGIDIDGEAEIVQSTIANNSSSDNTGAGGIKNSGNLRIGTSIVDDNQPSDIANNGSISTFGDDVVNLVGDGSLSGENIINQDALLENVPLDNGGPTDTHSLDKDSPAINTDSKIPGDDFDLDGDGNTSENLPFDQRGEGFDRVVNDAIDLGAVEFQEPVNEPPQVNNPISDQNATEGESFQFQVPDNTFSDPDDDTLTFGANLNDDGELPNWLSFNADNRTFSGTPGEEDDGSLSILVTAEDSEGATVDTSFNLNVEEVEDGNNGDNGEDDVEPLPPENPIGIPTLPELPEIPENPIDIPTPFSSTEESSEQGLDLV